MKPGDHVSRFEILGELGAGGMGRVFRARDPRLGREVAIKLLAERFSQSPEHLQRFEHEARAASALNHPNIVTVYEIGEHDGYPGSPWSSSRGRACGRPASKASPVDAAARPHRRPGRRRARGRAREGDHPPRPEARERHGHAARAREDPRLRAGQAGARPDPGTTRPPSTLPSPPGPGHIVGTLGYMSPEQARGLARRLPLRPVLLRHDPLRDALRPAALPRGEPGRRPERDPPPASRRSSPASTRACRRRSPRLVERCLAKDPDDRYASTRDLAQELASIRDHMTEAGSLVTGWSYAAQRAAPSAGARRRRRGRRRSSLAGGLWLARRAAPAAGPSAKVADGRRVVVLPFRDLSGTPSGALIGEGFAETVSTLLASGGGVAVLPAGAIEGLPGDLGLRRPADGRAGRRPRRAAVPGRPGARHLGRPRARRPAGLVAASSEGSHEPAARPPGRRRPADGRRPSACRPRSPRREGASPSSPRTATSQALGHLRRYENEAEVDAAITDPRGPRGLGSGPGRAGACLPRQAHDHGRAILGRARDRGEPPRGPRSSPPSDPCGRPGAASTSCSAGRTTPRRRSARRSRPSPTRSRRSSGLATALEPAGPQRGRRQDVPPRGRDPARMVVDPQPPRRLPADDGRPRRGPRELPRRRCACRPTTPGSSTTSASRTSSSAATRRRSSNTGARSRSGRPPRPSPTSGPASSSSAATARRCRRSSAPPR